MMSSLPPGLALHVERQPLEEERAAQRIDDVGDAAFVRDDLLGPSASVAASAVGSASASSSELV